MEIDGAVAVGVFDGHGGWQCAEFAQRTMLKNLKEEMDFGKSTAPSDQQIQQALVRAFERTDRQWVAGISPAFRLGFGGVTKVPFVLHPLEV